MYNCKQVLLECISHSTKLCKHVLYIAANPPLHFIPPYFFVYYLLFSIGMYEDGINRTHHHAGSRWCGTEKAKRNARKKAENKEGKPHVWMHSSRSTAPLEWRSAIQLCLLLLWPQSRYNSTDSTFTRSINEEAQTPS